ncbi:hypothetical protein EDWATA_03430 [Edwardsiella tarda ATCC 23685]|uniref:Uncharacterized protein n=1 Tax=Edwardsiella tarda ATCC 23685 TaxID=500638 RepID=D4F9H2_EDWTA|nr:hypothetical protein EDWATA_03430 [Edwardsiella tarda ATCC 23685]
MVGVLGSGHGPGELFYATQAAKAVIVLPIVVAAIIIIKMAR